LTLWLCCHTCCGAPGDQPSLAYVAARDAAYVALRDRVDLDRVVVRLRCAALALVDGATTGDIPDARRTSVLRGDALNAVRMQEGWTWLT
jgi:hypothetical protein